MSIRLLYLRNASKTLTICISEIELKLEHVTNNIIPTNPTKPDRSYVTLHKIKDWLAPAPDRIPEPRQTFRRHAHKHTCKGVSQLCV